MYEAKRPRFFSAGVGDDAAAADSPSLEFVDVLKPSSSESSELDAWAIAAAAVTPVAIPALYCLFARVLHWYHCRTRHLHRCLTRFLTLTPNQKTPVFRFKWLLNLRRNSAQGQTTSPITLPDAIQKVLERPLENQKHLTVMEEIKQSGRHFKLIARSPELAVCGSRNFGESFFGL